MYTRRFDATCELQQPLNVTGVLPPLPLFLCWPTPSAALLNEIFGKGQPQTFDGYINNQDSCVGDAEAKLEEPLYGLSNAR